MSYILQALKRSEQERQQPSAPNLYAEPPLVPDKPRAFGWPWLLVLLALNLMAIAYYLGALREPSVAISSPALKVVDTQSVQAQPPAEPLVNPPVVGATSATAVQANPPLPAEASSLPAQALATGAASQTPVTAPAQTSSATAVTQAKLPEASSWTEPSIPLQTRLPVTAQPTLALKSDPPVRHVDLTRESRKTAEDKPKEAKSASKPASDSLPAKARQAEPVAVKPAAQSATDGPLPTLAELPASLRQKLPGLTFSSHVYGPSDAFRSVTLNGRRLQAGDRAEGVRITAITAEGVVLEFDGTRFKIPLVRNLNP